MTNLEKRRCAPCNSATPKATPAQVAEWLGQLPGWRLASEGECIEKEFGFANFYETMGFVNALAFIANAEDHHPDLAVSYKRCTVSFSTHDLGGLSENDFVCAAKVDALVRR